MDRSLDRLIQATAAVVERTGQIFLNGADTDAELIGNVTVGKSIKTIEGEYLPAKWRHLMECVEHLRQFFLG